MEDRLREIVDKVRGRPMSQEAYAEQRIAFAFGNAPHQLNTTKEEVREIVNSATAPASFSTSKSSISNP